MRMTRTRKFKKQKMLVIALSCVFTFFLTVGYAAFTTRLTLNAKGNIFPSTSVNELKRKAVTTGDGLYVDSYEDGAYVFRGANPDNYLTLNGETWRIISIDPSGNLKIIKDDFLTGDHIDFDRGISNNEEGELDDRGSYGSEYYCRKPYEDIYPGCNIWGSSSTMRDSTGNLFSSQGISAISWDDSGIQYNLPGYEAYINVYLNGGQYASETLTGWYENWSSGLSSNIKSKILSDHMWNVGHVFGTNGESLATDIAEEKSLKWQGRVGLMSVTDYLKSNDINVCTASDSVGSCIQSYEQHSYLYKGNGNVQVFITPGATTYSLWGVSENIGVTQMDLYFDADDSFSIRPVLYLSSDVRLSGNGTSSNKYTILS